jgi:hypothetical protein
MKAPRMLATTVRAAIVLHRVVNNFVRYWDGIELRNPESKNEYKSRFCVTSCGYFHWTVEAHIFESSVNLFNLIIMALEYKEGRNWSMKFPMLMLIAYSSGETRVLSV